MRHAWHRVSALVAAELLAIVRDRWTLLGLVGVLFFAGGIGPGTVLLRDHLLPPSPEEDAGDEPAWACEPGKLPPVATLGDVPPWLDWPDPLVAPDAADLLLRFDPIEPDGRQLVEVVVLAPQARKSAVRDCLDARRKDARRARLDALGVPEDPDRVVTVRTLPPAPAAAAPFEPPSVGVALLGGLALLLSSVFLELGPRARAAGWMETWLTLPGTRGHLVVAWWLLGVIVASFGAGLILAGNGVATMLTGVDTGATPWALLPVMIVATSAVGVRAFLDVPDTRTAMTKAVPVVLGLGALGGLARLVESELPGWGGLVPFGGFGLVLAGMADGVALASGTTLAATGLLLLDGARALDRLLVREGALGRAAARRARGDYLPEALLLAFLAMAGTGTWAPPEIVLADVAARTVLSMALFLALPALLVSVPLELERAPLLSWRAPRARAWLALPVLVAGTLTLGGLLWRLGVTLFPSEDVLAAYRDSLGAFDGVAGLVAVSVVPGICEELLFRGAILGLLRHRFPAWGAILIQALCFALLHALAVRLPYTFALGVVFGVLVVRTGSLWPAIVAHAAHNFLATQIPADRMDAWLDHPAAWGVAALAPAAAWFAGRKTAGRP